jgi:hypothetical protein
MREYDMPIEEQIKVLVKEVRTFKESVETRFDSIDAKLTTVDTRITTVDTKIDKMRVLLEDTHAIAKLGLEGLQGLRESTDARFDAAAKSNAEQTDLLKSVLVHVRKRIERVEPPKRRRRP